jgi:sugar O-acyltransferase (sialic acid O-acetyltransferase NeuD family)
MIIYGAGGHAHVIYESLVCSNIAVKAVLDDDRRIEIFENLEVIHTYNSQYFTNEELIIAIGSNEIRSKLSHVVRHAFGKVIDTTSFVARSASIGIGTVILAKSILQTGCSVGKHVIVNTGAIVEHDAQVGDFCHLAPGSVICGGTEIGEGAMIGANSTILPGLHIGAWSVIGAGSAVIHDVPSGVTLAGNPAKLIES